MKQQFRNLRNKFLRRRLKNHDFTIIANNCIAGCVLHDLGMQFDTPTINLYIPFPDYTIFVKNLRKFVYSDICEVKDNSKCPHGLLGGVINIYFLHYGTFVEALAAWKRRAKRIHWDNIYLVLVERDGCTEKDLDDFDTIIATNKVAFTHKYYPRLKCGFVFKQYNNCNEVGNIMDYVGHFGSRIYDKFDWVSFFNTKM